MSPPQTFFKKRRWCFRLLLKKAFSKKVFVLQFHQAWNRGGLFVPLSQKSIKHLEAIRVVEAVLFRALIKYESFDGSFTFFPAFCYLLFWTSKSFLLARKICIPARFSCCTYICNKQYLGYFDATEYWIEIRLMLQSFEEILESVKIGSFVLCRQSDWR